MRAKELIRLLENTGWKKVSQKGSHLKMMKDNQIEIIPIHNRRYSNWNCECNFKKNRIKIKLKEIIKYEKFEFKHISSYFYL